MTGPGFLSPATPAGRKVRQRAIRTNLQCPATLTAAVLDTLGQASPAEWEDGLSWYARAHEHARAVADLAGVTGPAALPLGAGIIAALSPQLGWADNVEAAATMVLTAGVDASPAALMLGIGRAEEILNGADPALILGGRKVRSFYRNILHPGRAGAVTVDRHAAAVAFGWPLGADTGRLGRILERPGVYLTAAAAYRGAARSAGLLPHQCQAITWVVRRRLADAHDAAGTSNLRTAHVHQRREPAAPVRT